MGRSHTVLRVGGPGTRLSILLLHLTISLSYIIQKHEVRLKKSWIFIMKITLGLLQNTALKYDDKSLTWTIYRK